MTYAEIIEAANGCRQIVKSFRAFDALEKVLDSLASLEQAQQSLTLTTTNLEALRVDLQGRVDTLRATIVVDRAEAATAHALAAEQAATNLAALQAAADVVSAGKLATEQAALALLAFEVEALRQERLALIDTRTALLAEQTTIQAKIAEAKAQVASLLSAG